MWKAKKIWFSVIFLLLFSLPLVSSLEIVGNSVIEEDAFSKIEVYPATVVSPVLKDLPYDFMLTNKTVTDKQVYLAYRYSKSVLSGKIEKYNEPVYDWVVGETKQCNYEYTYNLNASGDPNNPHQGRCFQSVNDANFVGEKEIWNVNFASGDIQTKTVNINKYQLISGGNYTDKSNLIQHSSYQGYEYYYPNTSVLIPAGETLKWRLTVTPDPDDKTGKWELIYYTGANANCIVNGTCTYVNILDPWWNTTYEERYPVNIGSIHSDITGTYTHRLYNIDTSSWICPDSNSLAVVYHNGVTETNLDIAVEGTCGTTTDLNIFWRAQTNIPSGTGLNATDSNGYYVYVTSQTVASPLRDKDSAYLLYEDFEELTLGGLSGQNGWYSNSTIFDVNNVNCFSGTQCGYGEGNGITQTIHKLWTGGNTITKGFLEVYMRVEGQAYLSTDLNTTSGEEARTPYLRTQGATDTGIFGDSVTSAFASSVSQSTWYGYQFNFASGDINGYWIDNGETVTHTASSWADLTSISLLLADTTAAGEFGMWDNLKVYEVLQSEPTISLGAVESTVNFTISGTDVLDPASGVNSVTRTFTNTSGYTTPPTPTWTWLVDSVSQSTDENYTHTFTAVGDYNITLLMDWNSVIYQRDATVTIGTYPEIYFTDYNYSSSFSATPIINFGNLAMACTYFDVNETLTYTFQLNDVNVGTGTFDVNQTGYAIDLNFLDGSNTVVFYCEGESNNVTSETINFNVAAKNFYFVYDKTGVPLTTSTEYTLADVNSVVAYKLNDDNIFYDLKGNNQVGIYYTGDYNSELGFRISFNDITVVTTSRTFDLDVLDVNSVPMCFYELQPYFEQLLYSSIERDITIKNATNGCYHIAATTRYAANDFFSLYAYTIPLSYYLYINDPDSGNLTINLEGGTSGTINLDAIVLKNQLSSNIIITGDSATLTKNCGSSSDCNTFIITYRNLATNNSSVTFTLYNGSAIQLTYTETDNPDNFTYIFDATTLDFNADILTLRLEKTRTDGSIDVETIYFTPEGDTGFLDPTLVLIFSFVLFIGGITLATARFTFGWFGLIIGFVALILLSFSIGLWWISFFQGVMMMMLVYIGIIGVKNEGVF